MCGAMPVRATKRGAQRTPLHGEFDVLICGASFAGLAVARELAGSGSDVLVIDRYEIGERQTSACAAPTEWLTNLGLEGSIRQTFGELRVHSPGRSYRWPLPFTFSTFDYRTLCELLWRQASAAGDIRFETAKVEGITHGGPASGGHIAASGIPETHGGPETPAGPAFGGHVVHTDRGDLRASLVVDALGWRRVLGDLDGATVQPPNARLSRGLEIHPDDPHPPSKDLTLFLDRRYVRSGYSWSFPADGELRVGVGSFDPRFSVKGPTLALAEAEGLPAERFQGNWIPHQLRPATQDGTFFVGDSAGHCLPATAEGIRTALYFGLACGRELRAVVDGRCTREQALTRYAAFSDRHERAFRRLLRVQDMVGHVVGRERLLRVVLSGASRPPLVKRFFERYLAIAPPEFALQNAGGARHADERSQVAA
jgi:flavin-dependent dehydrogenase